MTSICFVKDGAEAKSFLHTAGRTHRDGRMYFWSFELVVDEVKPVKKQNKKQTVIITKSMPVRLMLTKSYFDDKSIFSRTNLYIEEGLLQRK